MLTLSSAAIIEKNKLSSDANWIILLEISLTDGSTIRVCRNTDDIIWDGETWIAFPFELDDMSELSAGEVPQLTVKLGNQTKAIQTYLEAASGGVGATVTIRVVYIPHIDSVYLQDEDGEEITDDVYDDSIELIWTAGSDCEIEMEYICTGCSATSQWATFTLGTSNPFRRRFPRSRIFKNICRWSFMSDQCGYTGTTYTTCNKTLSDCRLRENSTRYGGFPAAGTSALYVD